MSQVNFQISGLGSWKVVMPYPQRMLETAVGNWEGMKIVDPKYILFSLLASRRLTESPGMDARADTHSQVAYLSLPRRRTAPAVSPSGLRTPRPRSSELGYSLSLSPPHASLTQLEHAIH